MACGGRVKLTVIRCHRVCTDVGVCARKNTDPNRKQSHRLVNVQQSCICFCFFGGGGGVRNHSLDCTTSSICCTWIPMRCGWFTTAVPATRAAFAATSSAELLTITVCIVVPMMTAATAFVRGQTRDISRPRNRCVDSDSSNTQAKRMCTKP